MPRRIKPSKSNDSRANKDYKAEKQVDGPPTPTYIPDIIPKSGNSFAGFFMPIGVLNNYHLTPNEKLILAYILSFWKTGNTFFVSNAHLEKNLCVTKSTISKALRSFRHMGYIVKPQLSGSRRVIRGTNRLLEIHLEMKEIITKRGKI